MIVPPGGTLGILGGGQLGRMLALAAARLGIDAHIFCSEENCPASRVAAAFTCAEYDDWTALHSFAEAVDAVTTEFENVPAATAEYLAEHKPVRPTAHALEIAQDRVAEKAFLNEHGIGTAPWRTVTTAPDLDAALGALGFPAILKTRRLGYDGKGQARIAAANDTEAALETVHAAPSILEGFVDFEREISVIAARGADGAVVCYDSGENRHEAGILRETSVPAQISPEQRAKAITIATTIVEALDYVGVIGVEMFVTPDGLLVNEIAPRVHNTGHWTLEGCHISQFEQHVRAVSGWPLGSPERHSDAVMLNLLGDEAEDFAGLAGDPAAALHLYGKGEARAGRKMGHVTRLSPKSETGPV